MGPPPFGDGKLPNSRASKVRPNVLQWGHRLSAMERYRPDGTPYTDTELQWGHRLSAMERYRPDGTPYTDTELQWGHRLSAMESIQEAA